MKRYSLAIASAVIFIAAQSLGYGQTCPPVSQCDIGSSTFDCPISDPNQSQGYACLTCVPNGEYHSGIDMVPNSGSGPCCSVPVLAAATGTVHKIVGLDIATGPNLYLCDGSFVPSPIADSEGKAYESRLNHGLGMTVILKHSDDTFTQYSHLYCVAAGFNIGDTIARGVQLGIMGHSAGSDRESSSLGVHLHFERKPWGTIANVGDTATGVPTLLEWGYSPGLPNFHGFMNPNPALDYALNSTASTAIEVTTPSSQAILTGPDPACYQVLTSAIQNQRFIAFNEYNGWYEVYLASSYGPATGWIPGTVVGGDQIFVEDPNAIGDCEDGESTCGINVRTVHSSADPGTKISKVWDGQRFAVVSSETPGAETHPNGCEDDTWYEINLPGSASQPTGWVCGDFVRLESASCFPSATSAAGFAAALTSCCTSDTYEPDDSSASASPITDGENQFHNHCDDSSDWLSFVACDSTTYTIDTCNLGISSDTVLELYDTDGSTLITSDDDDGTCGSLASRISWTSPSDADGRTYYVKIKQYLDAYGEDREYDVSLTGSTGCQPPVPCTIAPTADFLAIQTQGLCPRSVQFTDLSLSGGPTCWITSWVWDFDDGSPLSGLQNPNHSYSAPGPYSPELTVTNNEGLSDSVTVTNYIQCTTPPNPPSDLNLIVQASTHIDLTWQDNSGNETEFRIERKQGLAGTYAPIFIAGPDVTSHMDFTVVGGETYFYRVQACGTSGCSAYSNEASGVTPGTGPAPLTLAWSLEGDLDFLRFGSEVKSAGDVNGDGYDDALIAARGFNGGDGAAYVFLGSAASLVVPAIWNEEGGQSGEGFGSGVAACDVNGDGYQDLVIGARDHDNPEVAEGAIYLYLGAEGGIAKTAAWKAETDQSGSFFAEEVVCIDVNGDSYDDVIVGAPDYEDDPFFSQEGGVFGWHGSATGLGPDGTPANADWSVYGGGSSYNLGSSISGGEMNGDTYDDLIVGASNYTNGQVAEGQVRLYLGSSTGLELSPVWSVESDEPFVRLGRKVAVAGDVDGNGYDDTLVSLLSDPNGPKLHAGRARLYYGMPGMPETSPGWIAEGEQAGYFFGTALSTAGDVNGDGYDDVIIGASGLGGHAYVYLGGPSGLATGYAWSEAGELSTSTYGDSVSCAGDVNGDGFSDVLVGSSSYGEILETGEANEGKAYLYDGVPSTSDGDSDGFAPSEGDCNDRDASVWSVPGEVTNLLWLDDQNLTWDSQSAIGGPSTTYDLMAGDIEEVSTFTTGAADQCLYDNHTSTTALDTSPALALGEIRYFLVRGDNECGKGRYETATNGSDRQTTVCQ